MQELAERSTDNRIIGIALGGGGARGFTHLGLLKILQQAGIKLDVVVGTSMGSVVGAIFAQQGSAIKAAEHMRTILTAEESAASDLNVFPRNRKGEHFWDHVTRELQQRLIINLSISKKALLPAKRLADAISSLISDCAIEDLPIKFGAVASDLKTGKGVIIRKGSLLKAIIASSSIPGFFPPVKWDNLLLVDGEVTDLIPVEACFALGANFVIAVDVRRDLQQFADPQNTVDILLRSASITNHRYSEMALAKADFVLKPITQNIHWSEFDQMDELIVQGEWEARSKISQLKSKLAEAPLPHRRLSDLDFSKTHIDLS
ncbi:MAG: patatin-like phospholipase family protein [bacterium]